MFAADFYIEFLNLAAVGKTDLAKDRKMRTDDIFWIASMSKPITSACIAILADDGKLSFDDPLAKYLPEFAGVMAGQNGETVKPVHPITLREVMTHTSGLGDMYKREPHWTLAETARQLAQQPLRFQPGSRWAYSTAGIDVLGRVVEVASGMAFDEFLRKRVLDPLGMKDTSFWIAPEKASRWAHSYRWIAQTSKLEETAIPYLYNTAVTDRERPPLGGAGLFSTAEDIARFYQMMLNGGTYKGRRYLSKSSVDVMTTLHTGSLETFNLGFGNGLAFTVPREAASTLDLLSTESFGHAGAFGTWSFADKSKRLVGVMLIQLTGPNNTTAQHVFTAMVEAAVDGTK